MYEEQLDAGAGPQDGDDGCRRMRRGGRWLLRERRIVWDGA